MENELSTAYDLIALARQALYSTAATVGNWVDVFLMAKKHDMAMLASYAAEQHDDVPEKVKAHFEIERNKNEYKFLLQDGAMHEITGLLEQSGIDHIILKGGVLRYYYPRPEMRTSADIDIFFDSAKTDEVIALLVDNGYFFEQKMESDAHLCFRINNIVTIEMHRLLFSARSPYIKLNDNVFDCAQKKDGSKHTFLMKDEDFYVYFMCHFAKHLTNAGSGLRSLVDLWVIAEKFTYMDRAYIDSRLAEFGLTRFEQVIVSLAKKLRKAESLSESEEKVFSYITRVGIYGTYKIFATSNIVEKKSGKGRYLLRLIFPKFSHMKNKYPFLKYLPFLLPFMYLWRILKAGIFRRKTILVQYNSVKNIDDKVVEERKGIGEILGI